MSLAAPNRLDVLARSRRNRNELFLVLASVRRWTMVIWVAFATVFAALWYTGEGTGAYLIWIVVLLIVPYVLHIASKRSRDPTPVMHREVIVAALIQGCAIPFLEFRFLPTLVFVAPVVGFLFLGGLRLLSIGLLSLGSASWIVAMLIDAVPATTSSVGVQLYCAAALLLGQLGVALTVIRGQESLRSLRVGSSSQDFSDEQTGLKNRAYVSHVMSQAGLDEDAPAGRDALDPEITVDISRRLLFTVVHVDRLRTIRHQYGAPAGERLVRQVAHRLIEHIQDPDFVVRWDAGEFLILTHLEEASEAESVLDGIQRAVRDRGFDIDARHSLRMTTSLGSALLPRARQGERLLWRHVVALAHYAATQAGRLGDRWLLVSEDLDEQASAFQSARALDEWVAAGVVRMETPGTREPNRQS
ncbi:MAG: diguanylate cyclase AdrA [Thermoanaerobaculia bacterium]|nr:diguanylate cyclase AdrA [Thermoanaerobaculia bacterium]